MRKKKMTLFSGRVRILTLILLLVCGSFSGVYAENNYLQQETICTHETPEAPVIADSDLSAGDLSTSDAVELRGSGFGDEEIGVTPVGDALWGLLLLVFLYLAFRKDLLRRRH